MCFSCGYYALKLGVKPHRIHRDRSAIAIVSRVIKPLIIQAQMQRVPQTGRIISLPGFAQDLDAASGHRPPISRALPRSKNSVLPQKLHC